MARLAVHIGGDALCVWQEWTVNDMRLIDADAIPENEMNYPVWVCLKKQPTIDAVPVVRCGACEYYEGGECVCPYHIMSDSAHFYPDADDYCFYGKRKDGDG